MPGPLGCMYLHPVRLVFTRTLLPGGSSLAVLPCGIARLLLLACVPQPTCHASTSKRSKRKGVTQVGPRIATNRKLATSPTSSRTPCKIWSVCKVKKAGKSYAVSPAPCTSPLLGYEPSINNTKWSSNLKNSLSGVNFLRPPNSTGRPSNIRHMLTKQTQEQEQAAAVV